MQEDLTVTFTGFNVCEKTLCLQFPVSIEKRKTTTQLRYCCQAAGEEPAGQQRGPGAGQRALRSLRGPPVPHRADWEQDKKASFLVIGLMRCFFALVVWLDLCTEMEVWRILIHDICQFWAPSHYLALSKHINNIAQIGQNRPKVKRAPAWKK